MKRLLLFCLLALPVLALPAQNPDIEWLDAINGPPAGADACWKALSQSVTTVSIATPLALMTAGLVTRDPVLQRDAWKSGAAILLASGLSTVLKLGIRRDRPFTTYPGRIFKKDSGGSYAFPSGHTTAAFATATSLCLSFPKWYVVAPACAYAAAAGYSRLYLGVHYPSDVVAGMLLGAGSSLLAFRAERWLNRPSRKTGQTPKIVF